MPGTVVGVASERDVLVLEANARLDELLALLDERSVAGKQLHVSDQSCDLVISRDNLHDEVRLFEALRDLPGCRARLVDGLGAVSAIGAGINASYANVRAGCDVLRELGIDNLRVSTSSFRITWMIPRDSVDEAVRCLHDRFVEASRPPVP